MPDRSDAATNAPGLLPQHELFGDWTVALTEYPFSSSELLWSDGTTFSVHRSGNRDIVLRFPEIADFRIGFDDKMIAVRAQPPLPVESLRHLLHDHIAPRLLANAGQLVLHAGAVETADGALLVTGLSGVGKSTLLASFDQHGFPLIGDDAMLMQMDRSGATARSLYRSLRLFPDSIEHVLGEGQESSAVAHYTEKRNVTALDTRRRTAGYAPLRAMFFLGPGPANVSCRRLAPSQACMLSLEHSFWLDPSDLDQTRARLGEAGRLADRVPAFIIDYPRRYDALAAVRQAMLEAVELSGSQSRQSA